MTWKEVLTDLGVILMQWFITGILISLFYALLCLASCVVTSAYRFVSPPTSNIEVQSIEPPLSSEIPQ